MTAFSPTAQSALKIGTDQHPVLPTAWHPWWVMIPRRTITGRLVRGLVWRRHDGRHWRYKKYVVSAQCDAGRMPGQAC